MNGTAKIIDSKQAFRWKAAWFSLLAPLGSALISFLAFSFLEHFCSGNTENLVAQWILGGVFIIQIISLMMGIFGAYGGNLLTKTIALIGMVASFIVGDVAFALLSMAAGGGC
jgi:hypothetical protein